MCVWYQFPSGPPYSMLLDTINCCQMGYWVGRNRFIVTASRSHCFLFSSIREREILSLPFPGLTAPGHQQAVPPAGRPRRRHGGLPSPQRRLGGYPRLPTSQHPRELQSLLRQWHPRPHRPQPLLHPRVRAFGPLITQGPLGPDIPGPGHRSDPAPEPGGHTRRSSVNPGPHSNRLQRECVQYSQSLLRTWHGRLWVQLQDGVQGQTCQWR